MQKKSRSKDNQPVDIKTVDKFELSRYLGVWHEIARYNHRFERGLRNVKAEYTMRDDGRIKVVNTGMDEQSGRKKEVVGKAKTTAVSGLLRVSFFWIFYSDYRILSLDDHYQWALVSAGRSDKYLWILSRTEKLPEDTLKMIMAEAEQRGFDTTRLMFI